MRSGIDQSDVGVGSRRDLDSQGRVPGLPHDLHVALGLEHPLDGVPEQRSSIEQQDTGRQRSPILDARETLTDFDHVADGSCGAIGPTPTRAVHLLPRAAPTMLHVSHFGHDFWVLESGPVPGRSIGCTSFARWGPIIRLVR